MRQRVPHAIPLFHAPPDSGFATEVGCAVADLAGEFAVGYSVVEIAERHAVSVEDVEATLRQVSALADLEAQLASAKEIAEEAEENEAKMEAKLEALTEKAERAELADRYCDALTEIDHVAHLLEAEIEDSAGSRACVALVARILKSASVLLA